jgi:Domain of unknown function (DUF4440)
MRIACLLILCGCCASAALGAPEEDPELKYPLLASLTIPKDELPSNCTAAKIPENEPGLQGLRNCAINTNPKFFTIGDGRIKDLIDGNVVQASYFGVYRERNECGIIAWAFASEKDAKNARQAIASSYANEPERFKVWQVKKYVIWLWRDPGTTDACFRSMEQFVQAKVNPLSNKATKVESNAASELEQQVLKLEHAIGEAVVGRDAAFMDRLWGDDFTYTGMRGEVKSKREVLAEFKSGELRFSQMKFDDVRVRVYGGTAVATGRAITKGQSRQGQISGEFRYTRVYVRRNGAWVLVAFQATSLAAKT